jgi:hypothetical protein
MNLEETGDKSTEWIQLEYDRALENTITKLIHIVGKPEEGRQESKRTSKWDVNSKTTQPLYTITRLRTQSEKSRNAGNTEHKLKKRVSLN